MRFPVKWNCFSIPCFILEELYPETVLTGKSPNMQNVIVGVLALYIKNGKCL